MRFAAASALLFAALGLAGCGGEKKTAGNPPPAPPPATDTTTETETKPEPVGGTDVAVYFVRDGKLGFAARKVGVTPLVATATLEELFAGPSEQEREAGLVSDVPPNTTLGSLKIEKGTAFVELSNPLDQLAAAQVVHTLTQFGTVERVRLEGDQWVRADTEEFLPAILVESPAPGEKVSSPLQIRGTANTFEANFMVELRPEQGKALVTDFVTATSGSGTRGTFEDSFDFFVDRERPGRLVVYERSAADNSIINEVEIPLTLSP